MSNNNSGQSFFRMDKDLGPKDYDKSNKILPPSQPLTPQESTFICDLCRREFTTKSGRTNHRKTCLKRKTNETTVVVNEDPAGNVKPDKSRSFDRIDGIVALIMGLDAALKLKPKRAVRMPAAV